MRTLVYPNDLKLLNADFLDTSSATYSPYNTKGKFSIVHFFTSDCDKCIEELKMIKSYIDRHPISKKLQYIFISSGPTDQYASDAIKTISFNYPVYYEAKYYSFLDLNKLSKVDKLYHTMLVDDQNRLLLFGSLFDNSKAEFYYTQIINCKNGYSN